MTTVKDFFLGLGGILVAVVLIVALVIAGWKLSWFAASSATAHSLKIQQQQANGQYQNQQSGTSYQGTLREQIAKDYAKLTEEDVQIAEAAGNPGLVGTLKVEAAAQAGTLCQAGSEVNSAVEYPNDQRAWFSANCQDGVLIPTSKYYIPSAP